MTCADHPAAMPGEAHVDSGRAVASSLALPEGRLRGTQHAVRGFDHKELIGTLAGTPDHGRRRP